MVIVRLARGGSKKRPFYAMDDPADPKFTLSFDLLFDGLEITRDGRFIEEIGYYNPMAAGQAVRLNVNQERLAYWQSQGAQLSETVARLVKEAKAAA